VLGKVFLGPSVRTFAPDWKTPHDPVQSAELFEKLST
jgi:hypothetical protein